jgi:hypothetical protein
VHQVPPGTDLVRCSRDIALAEAARVAPGKVAVVHPVGRVAPPAPAALDEAVIELDPVAAKGLEFDSVVVVEPAEHSLPELYVALTRTTRRLVLVSSGALPAVLADAFAG